MKQYASKNLKKIHRNNYKRIQKEVLPVLEKRIFQNVAKEIKNLEANKKLYGHIGLYWPLNSEVDLREIKNNFKIPIALPATTSKNGHLFYHHWGESKLREDFFGIPAPLEEPKLHAEDISILIVPALAIDQNGYRLGYGGGFFDRLRANQEWRSIPSLVVLPKACITKEPFPRESWDIPFDGWINEDEAFRLSS